MRKSVFTAAIVLFSAWHSLTGQSIQGANTLRGLSVFPLVNADPSSVLNRYKWIEVSPNYQNTPLTLIRVPQYTQGKQINELIRDYDLLYGIDTLIDCSRLPYSQEPLTGLGIYHWGGFLSAECESIDVIFISFNGEYYMISGTDELSVAYDPLSRNWLITNFYIESIRQEAINYLAERELIDASHYYNGSNWEELYMTLFSRETYRLDLIKILDAIRDATNVKSFFISIESGKYVGAAAHYCPC